ncbi:hypothetical protein I8J29_12150 [Paenibacillus sp. MWE-103]|uniref:Spore germination protein PD n=1 Tax=Paenibacillus artemisiicola TaxID=1172618 RepID=A0ABS3W9H2_9BACL|nr:hypothetical protein [Paenibacillus artemisiicola]MBO7744951.1 hypothetical protein [Paenibacillus artemisiicola]
MQLNVVNHVLAVGCIQLTAVASASVLQIGDTETISLVSMFDTPPESVIVGPFAPLMEPEGAEQSEGEGALEQEAEERLTRSKLGDAR